MINSFNQFSWGGGAIGTVDLGFEYKNNKNNFFEEKWNANEIVVYCCMIYLAANKGALQ